MSEADDRQRQWRRKAAQGTVFKQWCGWRGSNPRPLASEANTLSTELQPHAVSCLRILSVHLAQANLAGGARVCTGLGGYNPGLYANGSGCAARLLPQPFL
jgi:hypothetical protein